MFFICIFFPLYLGDITESLCNGRSIKGKFAAIVASCFDEKIFKSLNRLLQQNIVLFFESIVTKKRFQQRNWLRRDCFLCTIRNCGRRDNENWLHLFWRVVWCSTFDYGQSSGGHENKSFKSSHHGHYST